MRPGLRAILSSAAAIAAALFVSSVVLAHGGETFFAVEPSLVQPGSGVAVRADLLTSGPVDLVLAGTDGSRWVVGVVEETVDGHFEVVLEIPSDLPAGHWTLLAEADGATLGSATLEVAGTAVGAEEGGQGTRDEDDPLLVPLPSGWQASRSGPPIDTTPRLPGPSGDTVDLVPIVSLAAAIGALAVLFVRTRRSGRGGDIDPGR